MATHIENEDKILSDEMTQSDLSAVELAKIQQNNKNSTIGKSMVIKGNVKATSGDLLIHGRVDGMMDLKNSRVEIAANGLVDANIQAKCIIVHGELKGDLYAGSVIIKKTAKVFGNVYAANVSFEDGAVLKGKMVTELPEQVEAHMKAQAAAEEEVNNPSLGFLFKKVQGITSFNAKQDTFGFVTVFILPRHDGVPQQKKSGCLYLQKTGDGVIRGYVEDKKPKILDQKECNVLSNLGINFLNNRTQKIDDKQVVNTIVNLLGLTVTLPRKEDATTEQAFVPSYDNAIPVFSDRSVIGRDVHIEGQLVADEDVDYNGLLSGVVYLKNHRLEVTDGAILKADVFVKSLISQGEIKGDVYASELINIKQTGRLYGNVYCARIVIESGALVTGNVEMEQQNVEKRFMSIGQMLEAPNMPAPANETPKTQSSSNERKISKNGARDK